MIFDDNFWREGRNFGSRILIGESVYYLCVSNLTYAQTSVLDSISCFLSSN